ncbi:hypothetical protein H0I76_13140 [Limibaculum sp. M0105]|uniref:Uncharacterized protein n=1 Tax=Thermohalobaculum xanthum TaxID=2753746 RepID=A0A8J7SGF4_9RHOB|nr:hypothetical protein [Thermohalobaculum xanthum]MBK0400137.1 hypothetical protein [Thermohalobaculum xanthum]
MFERLEILRLSPFAALIAAGLALSGCATVAAGTAGGLIVDEGLNEDDGEFDPLENTEAAQEIEDAVE